MILPDKHLAEDRSLLRLGAEILEALDHPSTVNEVWERTAGLRRGNPSSSAISFDWFAKALTLLYAIKAITMRDRLLEIEKSR